MGRRPIPRVGIADCACTQTTATAHIESPAVGDNGGVDSLADLRSILAAIPGQDLLTLRATIVVAPNVVPGLMAFLDHAVGWELDRRAGQAYALQGPMAAIPDEERAASLDTLAVLAIFFRRDRRHEGEPIAALLDRVASILRADAKKPDSLH